MKPVHVRGRGCVAWSPFGLGFVSTLDQGAIDCEVCSKFVGL